MGWDVNVHVKLQKQLMLMMMMMMMMAPMKLVNSATKFRHGIGKVFQPNSGLRGSKTEDKGMYTFTDTYTYTYTYCHIHIQIYLYIYICQKYIEIYQI